MKAKVSIIPFKDNLSPEQIRFAEAAGEAYLAQIPAKLVELILKDGEELNELGSEVTSLHAADWLYEQVRNSMYSVIGELFGSITIYMVGA